MYIHILMNIYTYANVYTHIYIYTDLHTYMYTRTLHHTYAFIDMATATHLHKIGRRAYDYIHIYVYRNANYCIHI